MDCSTSDVLDAYRADLSNAGKSQLSPGDAHWLAFGTLLLRAVSLPRCDRRAYLASADASVGSVRSVLATLADERMSDDTASEVICGAAMTIANDAEQFGAFALGTSILDSARALVGWSEFRLQGRLLAQQSRILRRIGELDVADELCDEVGDMGVVHGDRELLALSQVCKGAIAQLRAISPTTSPRDEYRP